MATDEDRQWRSKGGPSHGQPRSALHTYPDAVLLLELGEILLLRLKLGFELRNPRLQVIAVLGHRWQSFPHGSLHEHVPDLFCSEGATRFKPSYTGNMIV